MSSTLTDLTAATTWSGTDLFYALVGGNSRKIAASKFLVGEASNVLAQVDSITAQVFRVYRTFTDSSNYERLAVQSGVGYMELAAQTAGTGTDDLNLRIAAAGGGVVQINTASALQSAGIEINNTAIASFLTGLSVFGTNLTSGQQIGMAFGKAVAAGNCANIRFKYIGDNDATNEWNIEFNGGAVPLVCFNSGAVTLFRSLSIPAGGSTAARLVLGATTGFGIYIGSGVPTVSAAQGSLYLRSDGSSNVTRMYVNTNGSTTWTAVNTVA